MTALTPELPIYQAVPHGIYDNDNKESEQEDAQIIYNFESITPEKVADLVKDGAKIGLFIGRTPGEKLPEEEGVLWISMDSTLETPYYPGYHRDPNAHRYHLAIRFLPDTIKPLQGLFEKVVVDKQTFKNFEHKTHECALNDLKSLLNPKGEGLLVVDPEDIVTIDQKLQKKMQEFVNEQDPEEGQNHYIRALAMDPKCLDDEAFEELNAFRTYYRQFSRESVWKKWHIKQYLKKSFREVNWGPSYPVRNIHSQEFFVARGLKVNLQAQ